MSSKPSTDCPDAEVLAACAEGRLAGDERRSVLSHVLECADCDLVFTDTLRLLDEDDARGLPPAATSSSAVSADPPAPRADDDADAPGGTRVLRFDASRWRRAATGALPLAAGALFALWLMRRSDPIQPQPSAVVASAETPTQAPVVTQAPVAARDLVDPQALPAGALPDIPGQSNTFGGGHLTGARLCRFVGAQLAVIEVRAAFEPVQAARELGRLAVLAESLGPQARAQYEDARGQLESGRSLPGADGLRPRSGCDGPDYDAWRAAEWVLLASMTRNQELLKHGDVVRGLALRDGINDTTRTGHVDRARLADLARLVDVCLGEPDAKAWRSLRDRAEDVVGRW